MKNIKNKILCCVLCFTFVLFAFGFLGAKTNNYTFAETLTEETAAVKEINGETIKYYESLSDAISSVSKNSTLVVLKDTSFDSASNKRFVLDINGKTVSGDPRFRYCSITINDSLKSGSITGKITASSCDLTINYARFTNNLINTSDTNFTFNDGYIKKLNANSPSNISGGTINLFVIYSPGKIHLSGGTINVFQFQDTAVNFAMLNPGYCYKSVDSGNFVKFADMTISTKATIVECPHNLFNNYICEYCNRECTHTGYYDSEGVCQKCGYQCPHENYDSNGVCEVCGYQCKHTAYDSNGVCLTCGYQCPHENYDSNGVCEICGYQCRHSSFNASGHCEVCNYECPHTEIDEEYKCTNCKNAIGAVLTRSSTGNNVYFITGENAFSSLRNNDKITLYKDLDSNAIVVDANFTLELNGHQLKKYYFVAKGQTTILDSKGNGYVFVMTTSSSKILLNGQDTTTFGVTSNGGSLKINKGKIIFLNGGSKPISQFLPDNYMYYLNNDAGKTPLTTTDTSTSLFRPSGNEFLSVEPCTHSDFDENLECIYCSITFTTEEALTTLKQQLENAKNDLELAISKKADTDTINEKINALNTTIENAKLACNNYADEKDTALKNELLEATENAKTDAINSANETLTTTKNELIDLINKKADNDTLTAKLNELNQAIENAKLACNNYADEKDTALKNDLLETIENTKTDAINSANETLTTTKNELIDLINKKADNDTLTAKFNELNNAIENAKLACNNYADEKDTALKNELLETIENAKTDAINSANETLTTTKNELIELINKKADNDTLTAKFNELNQSIENAKLACNNYADEKDTALKNELLETIENAKTDAINSANETLTTTKNELIDLINKKADNDTLTAKFNELNQSIENAKLACNNYADEKDTALKNELLENIENAKTDAINSANETLTSTKNELIDLINKKADNDTLTAKLNELNQAIENAKLACNNYSDEKDTALKNDLLETIENAKTDAINSANETLTTTKNELIDLINKKADNDTLTAKLNELNQAIENAKLACNNYADEKDTALKNELLENIENSKSTLQDSIDALAKRLTNAESEIASNANQIKTLKITLIITIIAFIVLMGSGFTVLYLIYKKKQVSK